MRAVLLFSVIFLISIHCVVAEPNQETLSAFAKWIQGEKVHSKYNLGAFPGSGLGGVARADVKENETLIMVPKSAIIYSEKIRTESFLKDFDQWSGVLAVEPLLVWYMSESLNPNAPLKPFFDILPSSYPNHPLSWTDEELAELRGTGLDSATKGVKHILQQIFDHLSEKLVNPNPTLFPQWNFDRFIWAYQTVNSRSWSVVDENGVKQNIMVPLADMLNHKPGAGVGSLSWDKQFFQINATQDYAAGEQVFDNYGVKSNYDLLSTYGFTLEENEYDYMTLQFSLTPSNLVHSIVEPLLKSVDADYRNIKLKNNRMPVELLRVFRLSVMEFSELEFAGQALKGAGVSLNNELKAMRAAINALTEMLKSFGGSLADDVELLKSDALSINQRNAIVLRKTQKEILINNIVVLGKMWENILLSGELLGGVPI